MLSIAGFKALLGGTFSEEISYLSNKGEMAIRLQRYKHAAINQTSDVSGNFSRCSGKLAGYTPKILLDDVRKSDFFIHIKIYC
jgi:hypothetical protein